MARPQMSWEEWEELLGIKIERPDENNRQILAELEKPSQQANEEAYHDVIINHETELNAPVENEFKQAEIYQDNPYMEHLQKMEEVSASETTNEKTIHHVPVKKHYNLREAIIWSEILKPPLAKRKYR